MIPIRGRKRVSAYSMQSFANPVRKHDPHKGTETPLFLWFKMVIKSLENMIPIRGRKL